jgi:hypothetical protein
MYLTSHSWPVRVRSLRLIAKDQTHDGVVTGCGESSVVLRETESKYGFSMSRPCSGIIRIGLDIHDDSGLVGTRDICAGVDEDQCVVIVRLEYGL